MSSKEEIIKFLIEPENFEGLLVAKNSFEDVRNHLISDFWNEVFLKIKSEVNNKNWKVTRDENFHKKYSRISIEHVKNDNKIIRICWERLGESFPYYGVRVETENNFEEIKQFFISLKEKAILKAEKEEANWPLWGNYLELDLTNNEKLRNMLPENRGIHIQECSDLILSMFRYLTAPNYAGGLSMYNLAVKQYIK